MLEFKQCCFCIPLKTGCLILSYLHLVVSIILAIYFAISMAAVGAAVKQVLANEYVQNGKGFAVVAISVTVILLLLVIILLTFSILLVVGIHKDKQNYVKAFLIYYLIYIILYAIVCIVNIAILPFDLSYVLGTLITILLMVYFILVIRSYCVTMGENNLTRK